MARSNYNCKAVIKSRMANKTRTKKTAKRGGRSGGGEGGRTAAMQDTLKGAPRAPVPQPKAVPREKKKTMTTSGSKVTAARVGGAGDVQAASQPVSAVITEVRSKIPTKEGARVHLGNVPAQGRF